MMRVNLTRLGSATKLRRAMLVRPRMMGFVEPDKRSHQRQMKRPKKDGVVVQQRQK